MTGLWQGMLGGLLPGLMYGLQSYGQQQAFKRLQTGAQQQMWDQGNVGPVSPAQVEQYATGNAYPIGSLGALMFNMGGWQPGQLAFESPLARQARQSPSGAIATPMQAGMPSDPMALIKYLISLSGRRF